MGKCGVDGPRGLRCARIREDLQAIGLWHRPWEGVSQGVFGDGKFSPLKKHSYHQGSRNVVPAPAPVGNITVAAYSVI